MRSVEVEKLKDEDMVKIEKIEDVWKKIKKKDEEGNVIENEKRRDL